MTCPSAAAPGCPWPRFPARLRGPRQGAGQGAGRGAGGRRALGSLGHAHLIGPNGSRMECRRAFRATLLSVVDRPDHRGRRGPPACVNNHNQRVGRALSAPSLRPLPKNCRTWDFPRPCPSDSFQVNQRRRHGVGGDIVPDAAVLFATVGPRQGSTPASVGATQSHEFEGRAGRSDFASVLVASAADRASCRN